MFIQIRWPFDAQFALTARFAFCLLAPVACWHLGCIVMVTLVKIKRNRRYPVLSNYFLCHGPKDGAAIRARINPRTHTITCIPTSSVCLWVHYFPFFFLLLVLSLAPLWWPRLLHFWPYLGSGSGSGTFGSRSRNGGGSCGPPTWSILDL